MTLCIRPLAFARPTPLLRSAAAFLFALFMLAAAGCDSGGDDEPAPTTGSISGTITLPAGAGGDIVNTRVSLFESIDEFERNVPTFTTATDAGGTFTFNNINPGSYFISAWKDNNNTSFIDGGDYFGVIGTNQVEGFVPTRQQVVIGENTGFNVTILILPPGFGISLTGTYSGSSQGATLSMTLTDTKGSVVGTGSLNDGQTSTAFTVTGSRNLSNVTLQISSPQLVPLTFTGTLANDASSLTGNLTGTATNGAPISVPFTLALQ